MNILVVNGSPRGAQGNTDVLVQAFLSGARTAGAQTDVVYLKDKDIAYCTGCYACWAHTPGVCIHEDDMTDLLVQIRGADVVVYATPLYGNMVSGQMKTFLDRTLPLSSPAIQEQDGQYLHPPRYEDGVFRVALICNAGFPETHHFEGLKKTFEISTSGPRVALAGMICCAAGPMLSIPGGREQARWYLDAVIQAGQEVVTNGQISAETQAVLDHSLADKPGDYADLINGYWERSGADMPDTVDAPRTPEDTVSARPLHSPDGTGGSTGAGTVRDIISRLPQAFSAEAAGGLEAVVQFEMTGDDPGAYYLEIRDGACLAFEGRHPEPRITIHSPSDVWLDVLTGKLDGAAAYMSGQYRVSGDAMLLMRFASLFQK